MTTIQYKYKSVLILHAGQLRVLVKHTSRLEGKNIISNRTDLICSSNKNFNNYDMCVRSFGQTNQLTQDARVQIKYSSSGYFWAANH